MAKRRLYEGLEQHESETDTGFVFERILNRRATFYITSRANTTLEKQMPDKAYLAAGK